MEARIKSYLPVIGLIIGIAILVIGLYYLGFWDSGRLYYVRMLLIGLGVVSTFYGVTRLIHHTPTR